MTEAADNKGVNDMDSESRSDEVVEEQAERGGADKLKSQIEFIRRTQDERAEIEAQRDEAQSMAVILENRLEAVSLFALAGVANPKDACTLLEQQIDFTQVTPEQLQQGAQDLLMNKSYLFSSGGSGVGSMPSMTSPQRDGGLGAAARLAAVAQRAARSGNRRDIAEYLRVRRQMSRN